MKRVGLFLFLLIAVSTFVSATEMIHNSDDVIVEINNYNVTLQNAIDNNWINSESLPGSVDEAFPSGVWHDADDFLIQILGNLMSLQEAVTDKLFMTGLTKIDGKFNLPHIVNEINTDSGKTFQEAFLANDFVCEPFTCNDITTECMIGFANNCGGSIDCVECGDGICINEQCTACTPDDKVTLTASDYSEICRTCTAASKTCDSSGNWGVGACDTWTNLARGTVVTDGACNGAGTRVTTFSDKGCSLCPFGYTSRSAITLDRKCKGATVPVNQYFNSPDCNTKTFWWSDSRDRSWTQNVYDVPTPTSSSDSDSTTTTTTTTGDTSDSYADNDASVSDWGDSEADDDTTSACFLPTEKVLTINGYIPIKDIQINDIIISYDEIANELITSTVGQIIIHDGISDLMHDFDTYPLMELSVRISDKISKTMVTSNHPYYDPILKEYKHVEDFNIGDSLKAIYGNGIIIEKRILEDRPIVYNLHMKEGPSNYIVNDLLVHNAVTK